MHWIGSKLCNVPIFDGIGPVDTFCADGRIGPGEPKDTSHECGLVKGTPTHWWETHHGDIQEWA
jgi:hypothetical protein